MFFHRYVPKLQSIILKVTKDQEMVTDIIQEVFFRLWMKRDQLSSIAEPEDWIVTVTYHQCFFRLRELKRRSLKANQYAKEQKEEQQSNEAEAYMAVQDIQKQVSVAIEKMTPQLRTVYLLSRQQHLTIQQIAEQLELSSQTVKNTISRALQQIRQHLTDQGIILPSILIAILLK
jgi:RNA polymerase sigma-70 factor (ECF subfamily)